MVTLCFAPVADVVIPENQLETCATCRYGIRQARGLFLTGADQFCLRENVSLRSGFNHIQFNRLLNVVISVEERVFFEFRLIRYSQRFFRRLIRVVAGW